MKLYKEMYLHLFNAVTDALRFLSVRDIENAVRILRQGQITCEGLYIESDEELD